MKQLIGRWVGTTYGTYLFNFFAEMHVNDGLLLLSLRASGAQDLDVFILEGTTDSKELPAVFSIHEIIDGTTGEITGTIKLIEISGNSCHGDYELSNGAKGFLRLNKESRLKNITPSLPQRIIGREMPINFSFKLYKNDIMAIIEIMKDLATENGIVVITEVSNGKRVVSYADTYMPSEHTNVSVDYLSMTAQLNTQSYTRMITLNLDRFGYSNIVSQSDETVWSQALPMLLKERIEKNENKFLSIYRKYGLNINFITFLLLMAILPSYEFKMRISIVFGFLIAAIIHRFICAYCNSIIP